MAKTQPPESGSDQSTGVGTLIVAGIAGSGTSSKAAASAAKSQTVQVAANDPNIPAWENQVLNDLGSQNMLSGVPPEVLAAIVEAESSGHGGGINSSNYGGFFGLSVGQAGSPLLSDPSQASFTKQAQLAAADFSSYLKRTGGNIYQAESIYQTGYPTGTGEGVAIMQELGIPSTITGLLAGLPGAVVGNAAGASLPGASGGQDWIQAYAKLMAGSGSITNISGDIGTIVARLGTFAIGLLIFALGIFIIVGVPVYDALRGKARGAVRSVIPL